MNFRQLTKGVGGREKTVALSGKKKKLNHVTECETNILARTQVHVPHSVLENFISCLFRKLSRQVKHFFRNLPPLI